MEGLRGLAVTLVFFVHYHAIFSDYVASSSGLFRVSQFLGLVGNTGVDLFFVLSGYLIYGALLQKQPHYLKFIERRIERIFPTFVCVLGLYLTVFAIFPRLNKLHGTLFSDAVLILANLLLLPGIFHIKPLITVAWSLSYEFFFYVTIPLVVTFTRMAKWQRKWRVALFLGVSACYLIYSFTETLSRVRLLMFVSGIILFEATSSAGWRRFLRARWGEPLAGVVFGGNLVFAYLLDMQKLARLLPAASAGNTALPGITSWEGPYKVMMLGMSCFLFILFCIAGGGFLEKSLCWSPLRYLGNMSYSFYLLHGVTLHGLSYVLHSGFKPDGNSPVLFCLFAPTAFLTSWLTSTLLFAVVEKPISLKTGTFSKSRLSQGGCPSKDRGLAAFDGATGDTDQALEPKG